MASWIVHLRLAENLFPLIAGLEEEPFCIGNVAPDSGVPDERWETFDPPPEVTHFRIPTATSRRSADLRFFRRYLLPLREGLADRARWSFLLGYYLHLVTDNLWIEDIYLPERSRFASRFAANQEFIHEIKRDWYGLDLEFVRSHPESAFWRVFLKAEYACDYLDYLPRQAIQQNLDYIKAFYQRRDEEMEREYGRRPDLYLSRQEMDGFVARTTSRLERIYRYLCDGAAGSAEEDSVLDLAAAT